MNITAPGQVCDVVMHITRICLVDFQRNAPKEIDLWYVWSMSSYEFLQHHPKLLIFPGYVCDIVMYITSTEKRYVIGIWCEVVIKIDMYITSVFFSLCDDENSSHLSIMVKFGV